jgi:hypothetical protein
MALHRPEPELYGLLAEFEQLQMLIEAARRAHGAGYRRMDAYTPFPVEGLPDALGRKRLMFPLLVFAGGVSGAALGYLLQFYIMVVDYPLNVGGRPLHSWPAFIPVTFEVTILLAGLTAVLGMLVLNRLPMPYHPVFNVPAFKRATRDRFFLCIESSDPRFDRQQTRLFLRSLDPLSVEEVEP